MKLIIEILLMGLAMLIGAYIIPGVSVDGYLSAIIAAVLIAFANATIGLILRIFRIKRKSWGVKKIDYFCVK